MVGESNLVDLIKERIKETPEKRVTFAQLMDWALYEPNLGYYETRALKIGSQGDFFTSSHLGHDFGELLAEQFAETWQILGCPVPFYLVEMGAGQGILAADILRHLQGNHPRVFAALKYIIVEKSQKLIQLQRQNLEKVLKTEIEKIEWKDWPEIASNSIIGCFFSNELIDAFPVHQVRVSQGKLQEVYVGFDEEKQELQEITADVSSPELIEYFHDFKIPIESYEEGYQTEVNLAVFDWLVKVSQKLQRGYLFTIDYGYSATRYYNPQRRGGTLKCYFQHRHHDNPYVNIGLQDLTAHVNFTALELWGDRMGFDNLGFTQQGLFLMALGLGDRISSLSTANDIQDVNRILQRRQALHQLIDPTGLGGFGVLIQSKGLTDDERSHPLKGLKG